MRRCLLVAVLVASACPGAGRPPEVAAVVVPVPASRSRPDPVEPCLEVVSRARAAGRLDLVADALGGAAEVDPSPARRIAWARALVEAGRPRRAREVLREDADPATRAFAASLPANVRPPPDRALADRVLAAAVAGRRDEVLRELLAREATLAPDMLHRLAGALHASGDTSGARRVWARVRAHHADDGAGWSVLPVGRQGLGSALPGPDGLTLVSPETEQIAYVLLPDGSVWSQWRLPPHTLGLAWYGAGRAVLSWDTQSLELRDADSADVIASYRGEPDTHHEHIATAGSVAAAVHERGVDVFDASLARTASFGLDTEELVSVAVAPSGRQVILSDYRRTHVLDTRTGQLRSLVDSEQNSSQEALRADGRLVRMWEPQYVDILRAADIGSGGRARWSVLWSLSPEEEGRVRATGLALDGSAAAVIFEDAIVVRDVATGKTRRAAYHGREPQSPRFSNDGAVLVVADAAAVTRYRVADLAVLSRWDLEGRFGPPHTGTPWTTALGLSMVGRRLHTGNASAVGRWDLGAGDATHMHILPAPASAQGSYPWYVFSGDYRVVAYTSAGELRVERDDGTRRSVAIAGPLTGPVGLGVDATGDRIAVATGEKLWIHAGEQPARALEGGLFRSPRMVFGPDWLMAHESPHTLLVWDLSTGTRLGVFRPADAPGVIDPPVKHILYWSGSTIHVAGLPEALADTRAFHPCGDCVVRGAAFRGESIELIATTAAGDRSFVIELASGVVRETDMASTRVVPTGWTGLGHYLYGEAYNFGQMTVRQRGGGPVFTIAAAGDHSGWAASTPEGIVDGVLAQPWSFALETAGGVLFDAAPFMTLARAPGMVPALLADGVPPACALAIAP